MEAIEKKYKVQSNSYDVNTFFSSLIGQGHCATCGDSFTFYNEESMRMRLAFVCCNGCSCFLLLLIDILYRWFILLFICESVILFVAPLSCDDSVSLPVHCCVCKSSFCSRHVRAITCETIILAMDLEAGKSFACEKCGLILEYQATNDEKRKIRDALKTSKLLVLYNDVNGCKQMLHALMTQYG
jgi:hypothetical protein